MSQLPAASAFQIRGDLNYPSAGGDVFANYNNPAGLGQSYANSYNQALAANQKQYNSIIGGYQTAADAQQQRQGQIQAGYGALQGQVANTLGMGGNGWGVAAPAAQQIENIYQGQLGQNWSSAAGRGLGNTTVVDSLNRGAGFSAQSAYAGLGANLAQTYAGYQANLGLAGLQYGNEANMQNTALADRQLGFMGSVNMPYPNAGAYSNLLQQYGYTQQANANRDLQSQQYQQMLGRAGAVGSQPQGIPVSRAPMSNATGSFPTDFSTGGMVGSYGVGGMGAPVIGGGQLSQYYGQSQGQQQSPYQEYQPQTGLISGQQDYQPDPYIG